MRFKCFLAAAFGLITMIVSVQARAPQESRDRAWRGVGPQPCMGTPTVGYYKCPSAPEAVALRAGRLFDSKTGRMLTKQLVLIQGDRIMDVGPEGQVKVPAGTRVIDLRQATVLPGLIDAHTHMFNNRSQTKTADNSMLIALSNVQTNLLAGFTGARDMSTHGNGYGDVLIRDAINEGRVDGPRYQVATLGIVWGARPPNPASPDDPLASTVVRSVEDARRAVQAQVNSRGRSEVRGDLSDACYASAD
ncbi:MAG: hypothetical protein AUI91_14850 [Acidobacteria bacterium 13_1_40CM_3_56_11]|nr:MAG: hypothetical protein AUI91_14850 [Acidobacteria bacterium 13_1_40CM_3_56_11]